MGTTGNKKGKGMGESVDDGRSYEPRGRGKIKTGPRSLSNSMRLRQPGTKTCSCGVKYTEGGECPMC